ncbi:PepSY-associated TM helix domain-containing protein [Sediminitomix flava]|uniref:Putative iron-regulated membrane protein n=1 Tax=Sediminitomix flava TaxID=379075 RepID=A0A315ZDL8_SEDFL|nr:PepSY-associated TM helix domain-containing protein [Sediminitomix flava]PWJ43223.1 putative iron-regulated membrane protein [Sediminitomix flava]
MKKYTFKQLCADLHLWLGIATSLVLVVVCFSGTIYTYEAEIKAFFDRKVATVQSTEAPVKTIDKLLGNYTNNETVFSVKIPADNEMAYLFNIATKEEIEEAKNSKERRRRVGGMYYVDQHSGETLGSPNPKVAKSMTTLMMLHRHLLLGWDIGRPIVGWSTIIFILISLTGFVLWLPKKWKQIKQGLTFKKNAGWKRINYDLHNVLGFYSLILILIMAITGPFWSFDWYRTGVVKTLTGKEKMSRGGKPKVKPQESKAVMTIAYEEILEKANQELDYEGDVQLSFPSKKAPYVSVRKTNRASFFSVPFTDQLYYDTQGELLKADLFKNKDFGAKVMSLFKAIHLGYVFSGFSKLLYFISCLIATSLPITGIIIWVNKLKKKKKRKQLA